MKGKKIIAILLVLILTSIEINCIDGDIKADAKTGQSVEIGKMNDDCNGDLLPFFSVYHNGYSEQIYTSNEIGNASVLTGLSLYCVQAPTDLTVEIYLADTTKSVFGSKSDRIAFDNATKVYSGKPSFVSTSWFTFNFDKVFEHDTTKNLMVIYTFHSPYVSTSMFAGIPATGVQSCYGASDTSIAAAYNTGYNTPSNDNNQSIKNHIRFIYADKSDVVKITMKANDGSSSSDVVLKGIKGKSIKLTPSSFVRSGYQFTKWNTKSDGSGTSYANNANVTFSADTVLYAQWGKGWEYDFTTDPIKGGWTFAEKDKDHDTWEYEASDSGKYESGIIASYSYDGDSKTPDNWAITPKLEITSDAKNPAFSMWAKGKTEKYYAEHFAVYVADASKNPDLKTINESEWTVIISEKTAGPQYTKYSGTIPSSFIGKNVYIAIRHYNCSNIYALQVDDVSLVYDISETIVTTGKLGDVNLDNIVDIKDLTRLARHVAEIEPLTANQGKINADTTKDGSVDIKDLTRLARAVAEIEPFN